MTMTRGCLFVMDGSIDRAIGDGIRAGNKRLMDGWLDGSREGIKRGDSTRTTKTDKPTKTLSLELEQVRRELQGKRKARAPVLGEDRRLGRRWCSKSTLERRGWGSARRLGLARAEPILERERTKWI